MADSSTNPILAQIAVGTAQVQDAAQKLSEQSLKDVYANNQAISTIKDSLGTMASSQQTIDEVKLNGELATQNANIDLFKSIGGTATQTKMLQTLYSDTERVSSLDDKILDIMDDEPTGIGIIDNVINKFRSTGERMQLKYAKEKQNQDILQIQAVTGATESFINQNNKLTKTLNEDSIAANSKAIAAKATKDAEEYTLKGIATNAELLRNNLNATQQGLSATLANFSAQNTAEAAKQNKELHDLNVQRAKLNIEQAAKSLADEKVAKGDKDRLKEYLADKYKKGLAAQGMSTDVPEQYVMYDLQANPAKAQALIAIGSDPNYNVASTPAEAQAIRNVVSPTGAETPTKATTMLDDISERVTKYYGEVGKVPKDSATQATVFDTVANNYQKEKSEEIRMGDTTNPYQAPVFSVLAKAKAVTDSPLYKKVLSSMDMKETNPETIVDAASSGVLAGLITQEDAAEGIATIFKAAAVYNNTQDGGFSRYGLRNQTSYNVKMKVPTVSFVNIHMGGPGRVAPATVTYKNKIVNMMSVTELQNLLASYIKVRKVTDK